MLEDCQNKMLSADWQPRYEVEKRTPDFIGDSPPDVEFQQLSMGMSL